MKTIECEVYIGIENVKVLFLWMSSGRGTVRPSLNHLKNFHLLVERSVIKLSAWCHALLSWTGIGTIHGVSRGGGA